MKNRRKLVLVSTAVLGLAVLCIGAAVLLTSPKRHVMPEPASTPPMSDPNISSHSVLATQAPGPLVPPASSPDITISEPKDSLGDTVEVSGIARTANRKVRVLIINEQIGMLFDGEVEVEKDGSWSIDESYYRKPSKGTRSVIRVTGTAESGQTVETNREVIQK